MSDTSTTFVPKTSDYPNAQVKAREVIEWLILGDIINPVISDCILNNEGGYRISSGAIKLTNDPEGFNSLAGLHTFGLEIIHTKTVFDTGGNGLDSMRCPGCHAEVLTEDYSFIEKWWSEERTTFTCTNCDESYEINEFIFTPEWGFSNLGFRFWNFPWFTTQFKEDLEGILGCEVKIIHQHI
nr:hypothetical protein [Pedobacter panaciterrae]